VLGDPDDDGSSDNVAADAAHAATAAAGATAARGPSTPANAVEQQAQLAQLQELEAKLEEERRQAQKLHLTLEQERAGRGTKAREAAKEAPRDCPGPARRSLQRHF